MSRCSWKDVRGEIRNAILAGRYGPGDRLPRDADIASQLNCARSTVQRAMQDLSDSGLVERRQKGGTRVRPEPVTRATLLDDVSGSGLLRSLLDLEQHLRRDPRPAVRRGRICAAMSRRARVSTRGSAV